MNIAAIKAKVDLAAADLGKPPFDSPLRTKRYTPDGSGMREIALGEWGQYEWINVTSINDPGDGHVFVGRRKALNEMGVGR
jgi:hypothetical protein